MTTAAGFEQIKKRLESYVRSKTAELEPLGDGRTVAVKVPDKLYLRLQAQMKAHGVKSVKQMVFLTIQLGLAVLEQE